MIGPKSNDFDRFPEMCGLVPNSIRSALDLAVIDLGKAPGNEPGEYVIPFKCSISSKFPVNLIFWHLSIRSVVTPIYEGLAVKFYSDSGIIPKEKDEDHWVLLNSLNSLANFGSFYFGKSGELCLAANIDTTGLEMNPTTIKRWIKEGGEIFTTALVNFLFCC